MNAYAGSVLLSGGIPASASIDDLDSPTWRAEVRLDPGYQMSAGLITIEVLDGPRAGAWAIGELTYVGDEEPAVLRDAIVVSRQPFGAGPDPEWRDITRRLRE